MSLYPHQYKPISANTTKNDNLIKFKHLQKHINIKLYLNYTHEAEVFLTELSPQAPSIFEITDKDPAKLPNKNKQSEKCTYVTNYSVHHLQKKEIPTKNTLSALGRTGVINPPLIATATAIFILLL